MIFQSRSLHRPAGALRFALDREFRIVVGVLRHDLRARQATAALFGASALCIAIAVAMDILHRLGVHDLGLNWFSLGLDRSVPEILMYGQTLLASVLTGLLFRRTGLRAFLVLSVLFGFVLLDDAFSYHETVGALLVGALDLQPWGGLRNQDLGELLAWGLAGLGMLPLLGWGLKGMTARDGAIFILYGLLFGMLVFFAVVVDMLHSAVTYWPLRLILAWVEDGGEALVIAAIAALAVLQTRAPR